MGTAVSMTWKALGILVFAATRIVHAQSNNGIESVIVFAEKREASIQDVPIAMSAFSADELVDAGIFDADKLAQQSPTLDLQRNAGLTTTSLRMRRVGNIGNIPTFEPAVGVFVDGAYRSRSFLGASNFLAVDHVEALRGPQTALYGKNVSAGLLALYTRKPSNRFNATGEISRGWIDSPQSAQFDEAKLDISGPLGSTLGAGVAAQLTQHGHTLRNVLPGGPDGNDENRRMARGQLAWSPGDALDLRLIGGYLREKDDQGESDVLLAPGAASTQVSNVLQQFGLTPDCPDNTPRNRQLCSVATNTLDLETEDLTLISSYRSANGWNLKSTTSWDQYTILRTEGDAIQLFAPILFYNDAERSHSIQEELQLESAEGADISWLIGSFYYRNEYERGDRGREPMFGANGALAYDAIWQSILGLPLTVPGQLGLHDSRLDTRYFSLFGQASWHITSKLRLAAAARWQQEEKNATIENSVTVPGLSLISGVLTPATTLSGQQVNGSLSRKSENVPWSITPQYRFNDDAMAYLTVARGYKSGGFNTGFGDAPLAHREFADESIHHYEMGAKMSLADRRVVLNAAAFYTRYDNYQDAAFISAQFSVSNAQRVNLRGIELEGSAELHDHLSMDFSVSLADLKYATHTAGLCYPGRAPDGDSPSTCSLSGEHPIQAPTWETHVGIQYERPVLWGNFFTRVDWSWTDDYNTSFSADPRLSQQSFNDVSLRIGTRIGRALELVMWSNNLLDEKVSHFDSLLNLFNDASYQSYLAPSRSYGLTLRFSY
jgi:outer membrane receptor protein involved in Fe transport